MAWSRGGRGWRLRRDCCRNPKREEDGWPSNITAAGLEKSGGRSLGSGGRLGVGRKGEEAFQASSLGISGLIVPFIVMEKKGKSRLERRQRNSEANFGHVEIEVSVQYHIGNISSTPRCTAGNTV